MSNSLLFTSRGFTEYSNKYKCYDNFSYKLCDMDELAKQYYHLKDNLEFNKIKRPFISDYSKESLLLSQRYVVSTYILDFLIYEKKVNNLDTIIIQRRYEKDNLYNFIKTFLIETIEKEGIKVIEDISTKELKFYNDEAIKEFFKENFIKEEIEFNYDNLVDFMLDLEDEEFKSIRDYFKRTIYKTIINPILNAINKENLKIIIFKCEEERIISLMEEIGKEKEIKIELS